MNFLSRIECAPGLSCRLAVMLVALALPALRVSALDAAVNPLEPTDRSSPRATMANFLENANRAWDIALHRAQDEEGDATRELASLRAQRCLDLSQVPPAEREDIAVESTIMLLDIFNRIPMPDLSDFPDATEVSEQGLESWQIPGTPFVLTQMGEGSQEGQWLFSSEVVSRIPELYGVTRELPLNADAVVEDGYRMYSSVGGSLMPNERILALPDWALRQFLGQTVWQWLSAIVLMLVTISLATWAIRIGRPRVGYAETGIPRFLLGPVLLMLLSQGSLYLLDDQINFTGGMLSFCRIILLVVYYLAATWLAVRIIALLGGRAKRSRRLGQEAIDRDLVDTLTYFASILASVVVLASGAAAMGLPLAGLLTGLGVGGIAVALAAQTTLENLLGGFTLFLDRPVRVGDYCKFGDQEGTVERIGLRSTRIRTLQRTIISVPNSEFSKIQLESLAVRDKLLLKDVLYLRMYTSNSQIKQVLDGLRETLLSNDRLEPESTRVRLVSLGPMALEIEVMAYATTNAWSEFLELREGLYLEFMRIVEQAGTSFVPPAQIQYNVELESIERDTTTPRQP